MGNLCWQCGLDGQYSYFEEIVFFCLAVSMPHILSLQTLNFELSPSDYIHPEQDYISIFGTRTRIEIPRSSMSSMEIKHRTI